MPRAEILMKQAPHPLTQVHAEPARKIETNRKSDDTLRSQMVQGEAVMKMLNRDFNAQVHFGQAAEYRQSVVQACHSGASCGGLPAL